MKSVTVVTYVYEDQDMLETALSINLNLIIYCTNDLYEKIKSIRNGYDKTLIFVKELNELDVYLQHRNIIDDKNLDTNIWLPFNKTSLIRTLAKTNPFKTSHFLWSNVEDLLSININDNLSNKVVNLDKHLIIPQNLAWHYRYLIDLEFHNVISRDMAPNETEIYKIVQDKNNDLIGNDGILKNRTASYNANMVAVIARYNEDVSWVGDLNCGYIIYNKNQNDINLFENTLPNIGREGHTFFTYIINNYESLPDYVCFLHGVPFDHCLDIVDKINNFNMLDRFLPLSASYMLGTWEWDRTYALANKVGLICEDPLKMISSCQSIVSKELILKTPKEMYVKLLNELAYHEHPQEAYIIENLWPRIFNFNNELNPNCDNCRGYWGGC